MSWTICKQLGDRRSGVDDLAGDVAVALAHAVELADGDAVLPDGVGELVHQCLVGERGLHAAEPAHRAARRVVREHPVRVDRDVGDPVRAQPHRAGVADHRRGRRRVRTAVEHRAGPGVDQRAVALGAELVGHERRVPVHVPEERLLPAVGHLHRPVGAQRQQAGVHVHRQVLAAAERATDPGQVQPHQVAGHAQRHADLPLVDVQPLGRDVEIDAAVLRRDREPGLRAQERLVLHPDLEVEGHHDRGGCVGIPPAELQMAHEVARPVHGRRVVVHGPAGVGDGGQDLVVDPDARRRPARGLRVVSSDQRDRLPLVPHEFRGQHRLVGVLETEGVVAGDVVGGEHGGHPRHGERVGDVDAPDPRVRVRAAQGHAPHHVVVPQVAGVGELAGDLERPVGAQRTVADPARGGRGRGRGAGTRVGAHACACRCAASRTASRIFS